MSGRQPPSPPSIEDAVTPSDVSEELNYVEFLLNELSGQDDYMAAMLENQRIMLMQLQYQMQTSSNRSVPVDGIETDDGGTPAGYPVDYRPVPGGELVNRNQLPLDAVGIANEIIYENDTGPATFQVNGTVFSTVVRMTESVGRGDPVKVIAPGNIAESVNNVSLSMLGLPGSIGVGAFEVDETDDNVTIQPGETEYVYRATPGAADWVSVGTNDETYSEYQYTIDGEDLLDQPLKEPLGLFNDPYQFPTPLSVGDTFGVKVTRQSDAPGAAEYFSKVAYFG